MLLDDTSPYAPGDIGRDSNQDHPLQDGDGYQSQNLRRAPTLTDDDTFNSGTDQGRQDPQFQDQFQRKEKGGLSKQAGRGFGKAKSAFNQVKTAAGALDDNPENRERIKQEAKDRIRKYARDKIKDKLGEEVGDLSKDALKKAAKDSIKKAGKEALKKAGEQAGKQAVKQGAKVGAEVGAKVATNVAVDAGAEALVAGGAIASAGPTLGLGLLIGILLEIAMYLGFSDAIDCAFELAKFEIALAKADTKAAAEHHKQARFHAQKGAMLLLMGFSLLIALGLSVSMVGWIIGVPMMVILTIYMIAGMIFPKVGILQGLSKKLLQAIIIIYDFFAIITILVIAAGILWGICSSFGLIKDGSWYSTIVGGVASGTASLIDWARGGDWASTFTQICGDISKF